jgi:hypothetical protein
LVFLLAWYCRSLSFSPPWCRTRLVRFSLPYLVYISRPSVIFRIYCFTKHNTDFYKYVHTYTNSYERTLYSYEYL